jgi:hypothetical protein
MTVRNRRWKSVRPTSLSEAMELCVEFATENRRPIKVIADLMGVEVKTLYRWLAETSMPLNKIRQFETFFGEAISLLARFYQNGEALDETVSALTTTLTQLAYQRSNVLKTGSPELELFGAE